MFKINNLFILSYTLWINETNSIEDVIYGWTPDEIIMPFIICNKLTLILKLPYFNWLVLYEKYMYRLNKLLGTQSNNHAKKL